MAELKPELTTEKKDALDESQRARMVALKAAEVDLAIYESWDSFEWLLKEKNREGKEA